MRTKDKILVEISKIKHSIELGCSTNEAAYRVGMVDGMHYAIDDDETDQQEDDVVTLNIQYKLDKEAYRQYVADMNQIEAEFKADNRSRKFIAGEELEEGDLVYKHPDGKMYKSEFKNKSENVSYKDLYKQVASDMDEMGIPEKQDNTKVVNVSYEGSMQELIEKLGYTIRASSDGKSLRFDRIEYNETNGQIPATLKDVCEWWIETYPEDIFYSDPIRIVEIRDHMKVILDNLK